MIADCGLRIAFTNCALHAVIRDPQSAVRNQDFTGHKC
jgi:hypothetical protein